MKQKEDHKAWLTRQVAKLWYYVDKVTKLIGAHKVPSDGDMDDFARAFSACRESGELNDAVAYKRAITAWDLSAKAVDSRRKFLKQRKAAVDAQKARDKAKETQKQAYFAGKIEMDHVAALAIEIQTDSRRNQRDHDAFWAENSRQNVKRVKAQLVADEKPEMPVDEETAAELERLFIGK